MIKINLLAVKEAKKRATAQNQVIAAGIVFLVVIVGVGYLAILRTRTISRLNGEISQTTVELARLEATKKKVEQFRKANDNLQQQISVITSLETGRDWYLQILDQISDATPEGVWVDTLNTPKGSKTGGGIYSGSWEIKGGAWEKDQIGNLISNLENRTGYFGSVTLKKIAKGNKADLGEFYSYEMSITVNKPPAAAAEAG